MASHAVTGAYVPMGVNQGNMFFVSAVLTEALANGNTFDITLPAGVDKDAIPMSVVCYAFATPTYTLDADIGAITTHNITTGVTRITATGNVASGSIVRLGYLGRQ
jgi:hypothetical protein